jgi:hypothetical protein
MNTKNEVINDSFQSYWNINITIIVFDGARKNSTGGLQQHILFKLSFHFL